MRPKCVGSTVVRYHFYRCFQPACFGDDRRSERKFGKADPVFREKATHALVLFEESTALVTDYMRQVIAKRQADGLEK